MAGVGPIRWWRWLPAPWRKWEVILVVDAADEIPPRLPPKGAAVVGSMRHPKWIAFDCPCRRRHRIMVNLDPSRSPCWKLYSDRPLTLSPSIDDRTSDRRCHFIVSDGRIRWAYN